MWSAIIRHEFIQRLATPSDWLYPLLFFVMVLILFPIAFGTESNRLQALAVPAVWIAAVFSILLGVNQLFQTDMDHGVIEQLLVARVSLTLWVMLRLLMHWLVSGGLLILASLLVVPLFGVNWQLMSVLLLTLLIGTPIILIFSGLAAALTTQLRSSSVLVPLVALPLQLPVIIFSIGMVNLYTTGMNILPTLALLLAMLIFSIMVVPWAIASILKLSV